MNSTSHRLNEFVNPADNRSLIVDTSAGLSLGPLPGLENFIQAAELVLPIADGIVTSPGQSRALTGRTRHETGLLIRGDWTNALRQEYFILPPERIEYLSLFDTFQAIELGASAIVLYFLLGHQEHIEAQCMKSLVQLSIQGRKAGLPVIVDVHPIGDRVVLRDKAIELGVSYAIEGGADGVSIPWPGNESIDRLIKMAAGIPLWIKPAASDHIEEKIIKALHTGVCGLWLDERVFVLPNCQEVLETLRGEIHSGSIGQP